MMKLKNFLEVKEFKLPWYTKHYILLDLNDVKTMEEALVKYESLFAYVKDNKIKPIYEKVFGRLSSCGELLKNRDFYLKKHQLENTPFAYIEGYPTTGAPISSALIHGISPTDEKVKIDYFKDPENGKIVGTILQAPSGKNLYLNGLRRSNRGKESPIDEFTALYQTLGTFLKENNFTPNDIVRTWIYLSDINKTYGDFNTARRVFFEKSNVEYGAGSNELPASTCIGGKAAEDSEMSINVICIDKKIQHPTIKRVYNKFQNEAEGKNYLFKPTFSRALLIEDQYLVELQVSGTASINETGETVYLDDPYQQIKKTLINVGNLLEQANLNFGDFCESTCFFKKIEYYEHFSEAVKDLKIGDFSNTFVVGDVCRDNLLFELDGIAIKAK